MSTTTFPNGQSLVSSAFTPPALETLFQPLVASILGIDPVAQPSQAYTAVRLAWQQEGQPAWGITDDVCILRATLENDPFSRWRDGLDSPHDSVSITQQMSFTQVWTLHATLYGPSCADHARLILSAMSLAWAHDSLAASSIYGVPSQARPVYVPEERQGQWWQRADIDLKFNELVSESLVVPSAAGLDVLLLKDTGLSTTVHIVTP